MVGRTGAVRAAGLTLLLFAAAGCLTGCGLEVVVELPTECFREEVVGTDCFTETTFVTVCETVCVEDFFGFLDCFDECFDEPVVDVYCEDVLIDSYLVCD